MIKIIPAILAKSYNEFEEMVRRIEPYVDLVHLDIADGEFVPNKTIEGIEELKKINTKLNFEVHLMISNPEKIMGRWLETKAIRFFIHWESTGGFGNLVEEIHSAGREFGGVLNPSTSLETVKPLIDDLDVIQFMTVDPGFYGSPFLPEVLEKITDFHNKFPQKIIQVDGGIKPDTIKLIEAVGVSRAAVGSFIFRHSDVKKALDELKEVSHS